jgi:hypothetical protein
MNSNETSGGSRIREHTLEIISAVMLSIATVGSAWSAYQATRWSGVQAIHFSQASTARDRAGMLTNIGSRKIAVDVGLFTQYAEARSENNQTLTDFLFERFPPRLATATEAWLETRPLQNPDAPPSPFDMTEYRIDEMAEARGLIDSASVEAEAARNANQTGDNYVLLTVLFASVLFFSGVGPKFTSFTIRVIMLSFGGLILVSAIAILLRFPIH